MGLCPVPTAGTAPPTPPPMVHVYEVCLHCSLLVLSESTCNCCGKGKHTQEREIFPPPPSPLSPHHDKCWPQRFLREEAPILSSWAGKRKSLKGQAAKGREGHANQREQHGQMPEGKKGRVFENKNFDLGSTWNA